MEKDSRLHLVIPDSCHEKMYTEMMERWEATGEKIAPQLLDRRSSVTNEIVSYAKWLEWCEDDRTTGSNLATKGYLVTTIRNSTIELESNVDKNGN